MTRTVLLPALSALLLGACFGPRVVQPLRSPVRERLLAALRRDVETLLRPVPGAPGLYFKDLDTGDTVSLRADRAVQAASLVKVFVLIEVHKRAYEGTVDLEAEMDLAGEFPGAADDCDALRGRAGARATVRRLCEEMIAVSSDCAANHLIRLLGDPEAITQTAHALGATRSRVPRYGPDGEARRPGPAPETTPADIGRLLERIALLQVVSEDSSRTMLQTLKLCEGGFLARALPAPDMEIAHKTGAGGGARHDAGIVFTANGTYVLAILMGDLRDAAAGEEAGSAVSRAFYDYVQKRPR